MSLVTDFQTWCCLCTAGLKHVAHALSPTFDLSKEPLMPAARRDIPDDVIAEFTGCNAAHDLGTESQVLPSWRELFITIGQYTLMLPQTAARICRDMGPERLNVIYKATIEGRNPVQSVTYGNHSAVSSDQPQNNWLLQKDVTLIRTYYNIVRKNYQNDQDIINKLGHPDEQTQRRVRLHLKTLQEKPYIADMQIIRLANWYCCMRKQTLESSVNTGIPSLQNGLENAERLLLDETMQSLTINSLAVEPFKPRNFSEHPEVRLLAYNFQEFETEPTTDNGTALHSSLVMMDKWFRFLAVGKFPKGSHFNLAGWIAELTNEEELLLTAPTHELEFRVSKIFSSCVSTTAPELQQH